MDSAIKKAIQVTEEQAQYDDSAKHLLGQKIILSHILARTVDEFKGMDPKDILPLIEGEPKIGTVPVDPGLTNATEEKNGERVTGLNTENSEVNEGLIRSDIVFYVRMRDGLAQIIVNVEAQKDAPGSYHLLNRAIFYVCRLVSSQKGRDFTKTNYDDMKRVYSIWICMDMKENSLSHVRLRQGQILGNYVWQGKLDMLNIVFIGLGKTLPPERNKDYRLHRLLGALLSNDLSAGTKLDIMENEYGIPIEEGIRKEMLGMCNLGQGVYEQGIAQGIAQGEAQMILNMYQSGYAVEAIAAVAKKTITEIQNIIQEQQDK